MNSCNKLRPNIPTKDIAFIAILSSIAAVVRLICLPIPQARPIDAFIIIVGAYLGPYYGIFVGILSILVSNCFSGGHGIWTLFQLLAMATIGFSSGMLSRYSKKISLPMVCAWGALSTLIIHSGIMTFYVFIFVQHTTNSFQALYILRAPNNISDAVSTVIFLLILWKPIGKILIQKNQRY